LHYDGGFDLSATVKAYFALKMIGDDPDAPHMARARAALLERGGADEANVFTRILLALFGETSWADVPTMPVELMLAPRWFPVHLSKMSYWARIVLVPLLVLQTLQPKARNPRGVTIRELFVPGRRRRASGPTHKHPGWARFFNGLDAALKSANGLWPKALRRRAIERARVFVVERLNGEDGLGGIFPAMGNAVKMFDALGIPADDPDRMTARGAIDKLLVINGDEAYFQPCVSPVWDTALAAHALLEIGGEEAEQAALSALEWLRPRQVLDVVGDWAEWRPDTRPGGWAFQYANPHYPDTDDTAVVVMAMDRARQRTPPGDAYDEAIERGAEWVAGLQSRNGGWGAFDADNTYEYLNNIPFADHGALLDQPTVDVTARCVGMMAQMGDADSPALTAALDFLEDEQEADGSWFRAVGRQLRLRDVVGAVRLQRGRSRPANAGGASGRGLACVDPEP
jgi:squalene-hopene/tetraprenyl-beta-curcumene cyclase